jgi:hypothetical protein
MYCKQLTTQETSVADSPRYNDTGTRPDQESPPGMPRWVKWPAIIIGILIVVFVVLQLTGIGGEHGPGRHGPGGDTRSSVAPTGVQQPGGDHTPPVDHGP